MVSVYVRIFKDFYCSDGDSTKNLTCADRRRELNERAGGAAALFEKYCGPEEAQKYREIVKNEENHIRLVRSVMDHIMTERSMKFPGSTFESSRHDYSKDEVYIFCTLMHFRYGIKDQIEEFTQPEIDRHLRTEPHHPEFEHQSWITGPLLQDDNLLEITVDRISRNLQFNSLFNAEQFCKFFTVISKFHPPRRA